MPPMTVSIRMPIILWCLMCVIFLNVYSAGLQSFIAVPKWTTLIDSLEDLANTNKLQLALLKDSAFESIILVNSRHRVQYLVEFLLYKMFHIHHRKQNRGSIRSWGIPYGIIPQTAYQVTIGSRNCSSNLR